MIRKKVNVDAGFSLDNYRHPAGNASVGKEDLIAYLAIPLGQKIVGDDINKVPV